MADVVQFPNDPVLKRDGRGSDTPPGDVIAGAALADLREVLVVGIRADGTLFAAASSSHMADAILMIERAKQHLMERFSDDRFG